MAEHISPEPHGQPPQKAASNPIIVGPGVGTVTTTILPPTPDPTAFDDAIARLKTEAEHQREIVSRGGIPTDDRMVVIRYRNHKGETTDRLILPMVMRFASTQWHPDRQWILEAWDVQKATARSFALKDILAWNPLPVHEGNHW
jgi:hypothetical protein